MFQVAYIVLLKNQVISFYAFIFITQAMFYVLYKHMCARPQAQIYY